MENEEPHYAIDSIDMSQDNWSYMLECGKQDTRLIKYYTQDGQYLVLRPETVEEDRRLNSCNHNNFEIAKLFPELVNEIRFCDIKIPNYDIFISGIHTLEGHKGESLCIAAEYIHGRCLPLNYNGNWKEREYLYYTQLDKWLTNITKYSCFKFLSANEETYFLTDVFRPVQFVYSFDNNQIYLVDLDPLYDKTLTDQNTINKRFLQGIQTVNNYRNKYSSRLNSQNEISLPNFGLESKELMIKLTQRKDFIQATTQDRESAKVMRNLQQGLHYKKFPLQYSS